MRAVCAQQGCGATALARVSWPGRGWVSYCLLHALQAAEVLDAMGCPSPPEALPDPGLLRRFFDGTDRMV